MSSSAISRRYAKALVDLGAEQKMVERYGDELARVSSAFAAESALRLILESPTFPAEKKTAILVDLTEKLQLSGGMKSFLGLLLAKDRIQYLAQIEGNYRQLADELSGILRARIISAAELDAGQCATIRASLEKQSGKKVELKVDIEPSLIGGVQVEIGGKVFDGSVKTQLKRIEDTLKKG
ncbi:MAG TPA: ATP synthase F1 subunit delta [Desulfuromonadales bacterium]